MQLPTQPSFKRRLFPTLKREVGRRTEPDSQVYVDFSSNDYLGLSSHPFVVDALKTALDRWPAGSTGSRLLSGDYQVSHLLEAELAAFLGVQNVLLFNSGYHANLGAIPSLMGPGDGVFLDKLSHASMIDGCRLSGSQVYRYKHQSRDHLTSLLAAHRATVKRAWIMTESVFSMDGDVTDFSWISPLKKEFDCQLYVDDSHGFGICGARGQGAIDPAFQPEVDVLVNGFGKGMGLYGGMLGASSEICESLIQGCRSFLFSTALPPFYMEGLRQSLTLLEKADEARQKVKALSDYFRESCKSLGYEVLGQSHIIPVVIGPEDRATDLSEFLKTHGIWVMPIRTPTVAPGQARLRFSLTVHHTVEQLDHVLALLKESQSHV